MQKLGTVAKNHVKAQYLTVSGIMRNTWEGSGSVPKNLNVLMGNSLDSNCVSIYSYHHQKYFLPLSAN